MLSRDQTNEYDPNPRPRIKLREWHLTAKTAERATHMEFVTLYQPHRAQDKVERQAALQTVPGGYVLRAALPDGSLTALLPTDDSTVLQEEGMTTRGVIKVRLEHPQRSAQIVAVQERQEP
jgi:hypothetical protein